jgi:hypothetical protein
MSRVGVAPPQPRAIVVCSCSLPWTAKGNWHVVPTKEGQISLSTSCLVRHIPASSPSTSDGQSYSHPSQLSDGGGATLIHEAANFHVYNRR